MITLKSCPRGLRDSFRAGPWCLSLALGLTLAASGCGKGGAPEPLTPEQAPAEITQAFAKAKPEVKEFATKAAEALQAKRYPEASTLLMELSRAPDLSAKERETVSRAVLGVNRLLREAQTQGDAQSAEHLRRLQQSK